MKITVKKVIPIVTFLIGAIWTFKGITEFDWFIDDTPSPGFFPSIIGILIMSVSVLALISDWNKQDEKYELRQAFPVLAIIAIILASFIIGLLPAIFLFMIYWLKYYEKYSWKFTIIFTVVMVGIIVGVFKIWLNIPFPTGLF